MSDSILHFEEVSIDYKTEQGWIPAVTGINLELHKGMILGLVGESGSGKSTVGLAAMRMLAPNARSRGRVVFEGQDLLELPDQQMAKLRGKRISIVFQNPLTSLNPALPIGVQVAETFQVHEGLSANEAWDQAIDLLSKVGISQPAERTHFYPHQFSGGMQQRVLIAISLACRPKVLILDEPTTALDVTVEAEILHLFRQLNKEYQSTVMYITHDLRVVREMCNFIAVMYSGQILEMASADLLFNRPLHPYTKGLLASIPSLTVGKKSSRLCSIGGRLPDQAIKGCIFHPRCPFVENDCCTMEQQLSSQDKGHMVRCWKAQKLAGIPWPIDEKSSVKQLNATLPKTSFLLEVKNLKKRYGGHKGPFARIFGLFRRGNLAVGGISFSIESGKTFSLVGESGCGKSTIGRCIVGLTHPTGGNIQFNGIDIHLLNGIQRKEYRRSIQIIFQNPESSLNMRKTVGQSIIRPLELYGLARGAKAKRRVEELLYQVQLPGEYTRRYPHELSGGEKQRVAIARALAAEPRMIICDEPVTALDVSVQAEILNLLVDLQNQHQLAYLFIAHDLGIVRYISDIVAVMYKGLFCEVGTVEQVFSPHYHPYTSLLLRSIPAPDFRPRFGSPPGFPADRAEHEEICRFFHRCPVVIPGLCDQVFPSSQSEVSGHVIYCHHSVEELQGLENGNLIKEQKKKHFS